MLKTELRTLRGQLLLIAGLFAGCIAAAGIMATQRALFERFLCEKYAPLPADLRKLAQAAAEGRLDAERLRQLSEPQQLALYDDWMAGSEPRPEAAPRALAAACPALYLARAERTLVCGGAEQCRAALEFLRLSQRPEVAAVLERVERWAGRRCLSELCEEIRSTRGAIGRAATTDPPCDNLPTEDASTTHSPTEDDHG